jgi:hypothetical protein
MTQTRIVLETKHRPKADRIMEETGISTLSQLFSILLVCYGDHLVSSMKSPTVQLPTAQAGSDLPKLQSKPAQTKQFAPLSGI